VRRLLLFNRSVPPNVPIGTVEVSATRNGTLPPAYIRHVLRPDALQTPHLCVQVRAQDTELSTLPLVLPAPMVPMVQPRQQYSLHQRCRLRTKILPRSSHFIPIGPRRGAVPCAATTGSVGASAVAIVSEHPPTPAGRRGRGYVATDAPHANGDYAAQNLLSHLPLALSTHHK